MKEKFEALGPVSFLIKPVTQKLMAEAMQGVFQSTEADDRDQGGAALRASESAPDEDLLPLYS